MTVEIGINPITWTNDDVPELGGDIPLETCLSEASGAGYAGIEMGGKFPRKSDELGWLLVKTRATARLGVVRWAYPRSGGQRGIRCHPAPPHFAPRSRVQGGGIR